MSEYESAAGLLDNQAAERQNRNLPLSLAASAVGISWKDFCSEVDIQIGVCIINSFARRKAVWKHKLIFEN
jgi:hypothetical protein